MSQSLLLTSSYVKLQKLVISTPEGQSDHQFFLHLARGAGRLSSPIVQISEHA